VLSYTCARRHSSVAAGLLSSSSHLQYNGTLTNHHNERIKVRNGPAKVGVDRHNDCDVPANQSRRSKLGGFHGQSLHSYSGLQLLWIQERPVCWRYTMFLT